MTRHLLDAARSIVDRIGEFRAKCTAMYSNVHSGHSPPAPPPQPPNPLYVDDDREDRRSQVIAAMRVQRKIPRSIDYVTLVPRDVRDRSLERWREEDKQRAAAERAKPKKRRRRR